MVFEFQLFFLPFAVSLEYLYEAATQHITLQRRSYVGFLNLTFCFEVILMVLSLSFSRFKEMTKIMSESW